MKHRLFYSSALGVFTILAPAASQAAIETTTTTTYTYDFPTSTPITSEDVDVVTDCPVTSGGGDGNGGFGVDVNGDGVGDYGSFADAEADGFSNGTAVGNHDNPYGQDVSSCGNCGGDTGGGGGYSCMIVTHFYRRGLFTKKEWLLNKRDALSGRLDMRTLYGYHVWAPYAVMAMRKSPLVERIFFQLFTSRNRTLEYYQGKSGKVAFYHHMQRWILEAPSMIIGRMDIKPDHAFNYSRIYETPQDKDLIASGYYPHQPKGMIGW